MKAIFQALETEGHDPQTYKFQVGDTGGSASMKQKNDEDSKRYIIDNFVKNLLKVF